jgi:hypothetical protein
MNVYWCHEKDDYKGLFVKASTRGRAKLLYSDYVECKMIDVRTSIARRGILPEYFEGVIEYEAELEKYGLSYSEEEE